MTTINTAAMNFATKETLEHMVKKTDGMYTAAEIMETIVKDPNGNTAKFFAEHLVLAYKTVIEVSMKNAK